ncbi:hypothetical protein LCGC14_1542760 [marine sediment metagenome]|uniref:Uncharacterized protein n=1 Tax=marine sediment metagenome TaxID=412755 RepID=A0A0F9LTD3_9ZZZZ
MRISESFESKWLKAANLQGQRVSVVISHVTTDNVGTEEKPETKPIVFFVGKDKGLVLNKTNAEQISAMYGDETDSWVNKTIELFTQKVPFNGQMVDAIRIAPPPNVPMTGQPMPDGRPTLDTPPVKVDGDPPF